MKLSKKIDRRILVVSAVALAFTVLYTSASYQSTIVEATAPVDLPVAIEIEGADWQPVCGYLPGSAGLETLSMVGVEWSSKRAGTLLVETSPNDPEMDGSDFDKVKSNDKNFGQWTTEVQEGQTIFVPFSISNQDDIKSFLWSFEGKEKEIRVLTQNQLVDQCQLIANKIQF